MPNESGRKRELFPHRPRARRENQLRMSAMKKPILIFPALIMLVLAAENGRQAYIHVAHSMARACLDGVFAIVGLFGAACFLYIGIKGAKNQDSGSRAIENLDQRSRGDLLL